LKSAAQPACLRLAWILSRKRWGILPGRYR
jgi:hypothetical protein